MRCPNVLVTQVVNILVIEPCFSSRAPHAAMEVIGKAVDPAVVDANWTTGEEQLLRRVNCHLVELNRDSPLT